jgi:hypothetical protein
LDQLSRGVDQELAREAGIQPKASGERRGSSAQQPGQSAAESHPGPDGEQGTPAQSPKQESPKQESPEQESPEQQGSEQQGSEQQGSAARSQGNRDEQTERRGGSSGSSGSSQQQQQQQQQGSPQGQQPGRGQPSESSGAEGQQGERQEGQQADQPNAEGRPGEQASEPPGDQPSDAQRSSSQPGSEQGDQQGAGQQPSPQAGGQGRQQAGGSSQSQSGGRRPAPGLRGDSPGRSGRGEADRERRSESNRWAAESPSGGGAIGPITGDFRTWSDRMRDVEEMVDDPELRGRAMTIRDRVRQMRGDMKRHGEQPQWELVDEMIAQPLRELKREVRAELLRRTAAKNQLVPIDRDPVPAEFSEAVQRYYENLGSTNPDAPAEARR